MTVHLVQEISIRIHLLRSNKGSQNKGKCDNHLLTGHAIFCSLTILELNTFADRTKCCQHPISLRKKWIQISFWDTHSLPSAYSRPSVLRSYRSVLSLQLAPAKDTMVWSVCACVSICTDTAQTVTVKLAHCITCGKDLQLSLSWRSPFLILAHLLWKSWFSNSRDAILQSSKIDLYKEEMLYLCSIIYFILQLFKVYSQQESTTIPINIELLWTKIFTCYKRFRFS